jgi:hypothetical protein
MQRRKQEMKAGLDVITVRNDKQGKNCKMCKHYKRCIEHSRMYPCREFASKTGFARLKIAFGL